MIANGRANPPGEPKHYFRLGGDASPHQVRAMTERPERKRLHHEVPEWVNSGAMFFITINLAERGSERLVRSEVASPILESAQHYHTNGIWWLRLILLMPNHVHALLTVSPDRQLARTVTAWKSYQTKTLGLHWQAGFFDHRLRSAESLAEKALYVRMNPVRAGLVAQAEQWPHVWSPDR